MTKAQEVTLLDEMIARFGPDSYLGPWLAEHREDILADIRNDVSVSAPMPSVAQARAIEILNDARAEAERIVAEAKKAAAETRQRASLDITNSRAWAASQMLEAARKLQRGY